MVSASPMMAPTVMRGLSEANGSWKMICMSRRSAWNAAGSSAVTLRPANQISPALGSISRRMQRPGGGFSRAGLADQPERLARREVEAHAIDRVNGRGLAQPPSPHLEIHREIFDAQQRFRGCALPRSSLRARSLRRHPSSGCVSTQATLWPPPISRSGGTASRQIGIA